MKNVMTYYFFRTQNAIRSFLKYQIDISLMYGWKPEDILILTNYKIDYRGVKAIYYNPKRELWSRYIYRNMSIVYLFKEIKLDGIIWYHDWDAIQSEIIDYKLPNNKDISIYYGYYYERRGQPNGGSMFMRSSVVDMFEQSLEIHRKSRNDASEPSMQMVFRNNQNRIEHLNSQYNFGDTASTVRYKNANKPIKIWHFKITRQRYAGKFLYLILQEAKKYKDTGKILPILVKYIEDRICKYNSTRRYNKYPWVQEILPDVKKYIEENL